MNNRQRKKHSVRQHAETLVAFRKLGGKSHYYPFLCPECDHSGISCDLIIGGFTNEDALYCPVCGSTDTEEMLTVPGHAIKRAERRDRKAQRNAVLCFQKEIESSKGVNPSHLGVCLPPPPCRRNKEAWKRQTAL
jgi:hypothetical protein